MIKNKNITRITNSRAIKKSKTRNLELFILLDIAEWKKKMKKIKKEQKFIKINNKLLKKFAKILARL